MKYLHLILAFLIAGCTTTATPPQSLDALAARYVKLQLVIGEKEAGYIDAYYGPAEWQAEAKASAPAATLPGLAAQVAELRSAVEGVDPARLDAMEARRRAFLLANLTAAATRLRMMQGEKLSFQEEAQGLFGTAPELRPLSSYDGALAKLDALLPGEGALWQRVEAHADRFVVPEAKLKPVMDAAIAECKARTVRRIALPEGEKFTLEFVKNKSWSGYNWYQGNYHSLIQVNTDLPFRMSRAVDLGCHEGYPGHHALNMLLEEKLTRGRGWVEFSLYPLYSPQSLIAEGSANYGIDLAFPGPELAAFEDARLYPLAGIAAPDTARNAAIAEASAGLEGSRFTIAADYLEGRVGKEETLARLQKYGPTSRARAEQSLSFIDQYRSYVINYGHGKAMVRDYVERAGDDPAARWAAFERVISEPTLPADLLR